MIDIIMCAYPSAHDFYSIKEIQWRLRANGKII